ncbi:MAG: hypothetical protein GYA21_06680 [Myxococcales bacterium]|nr:hypothetical protein [Myxococcales bacterium]
MKTMLPVTLFALVSLLAGCSDSSRALSPWKSGLSDEPALTRIYTPAPEKLRAELIRRGLDVTGSHHRLGYVDVYATPEKRDAALRDLTARVSRLETLDHRRSALALSDYRNPAEVSAYLDSIAATYPNLARKVDLTPSGLFEGNHVYAMKISDNVATDEDEPTILFTSQIHAREVMTEEITCDIADYLTSRYASDPEVKQWVDSMEIWVIPQVNPDGAAYVFSTYNYWRKNRHPNCEVDNNRNFVWNWAQCPGSSGDCGDDTHHGASAGSEPETQATDALMAELRPMYYIDFHSYGEYILWPSGCEKTEEDDLFRLWVSEVNAILPDDDGQTGNFTIGNTADTLYTAPGGTDDHAYGAYGALGVTIEINRDFQPDFASLRNPTVQRMRNAWQYLIRRTLNGPSVRGHTFDAQTGAPVVAHYQFSNHPFTHGQWPLRTDAVGRFGRALMPNSDHVVVFTAPGYLPAARSVHVGTGPADLEVPMTAGTNHAPTVVVGPDQTVNEGDTVTLDASQSSDPDPGTALVFVWTQTGGPAVALRNASTATPSFFAPGVSQDTVLTFQVVASDGELSSAPATTRVTVRNMWDESTTFPSADTPISIPDADDTGITSIIHVSDNRPILSARAHVDITHTYIGDLIVELTSPSGTRVVLHDHAGGSTQNLHAEYELIQVAGEMAGGDWRLHVADTAGGDSGTLDAWTLTLELVGDPPCQQASDCQLPHTLVADCVAGRCEVVTCAAGFGNCNGIHSDGCETVLASDPLHCGSCENACAFPHAAALCQNSACVMGACEANYGDCNASAADGCEIPLASDPLHCGSCENACSFPHASALCQTGQCRLGTCEALFGNCDGVATNGCESDLSADPSHCGTCTRVCNLAHATSKCVAGACQVDTCQGSWADCDGAGANGCEADLDTNVAHCGDCAVNCQALNAQVSCQAGACVMGACLSGYADCDGAAATGCEADLRSDPLHCGACDAPCALAHAQAACASGSCRIGQCETGFGDCNHLASDGCESDTGSDPQNCGACGTVCAVPHAQNTCVSGACAVAGCEPSFGDCNGSAADGCETYLNNNDAHCGACNHSCDVPHGSATCRSGDCSLQSCEEGFGNCDGDSDTGCEAELASDPQNCGRCGNECTPAHGTGGCAQGACVIASCETGFGDCNDTAADGCETDLVADQANCGACAHACPAGQECRDSQCAEPCPDADGDGHPAQACGGDDCDDTRAGVHPGASETCNGRDDDCDGKKDDGLECSEGCGCGPARSGGAGGLLLPLLALVLLRRRRTA